MHCSFNPAFSFFQKNTASSFFYKENECFSDTGTSPCWDENSALKLIVGHRTPGAFKLFLAFFPMIKIKNACKRKLGKQK